jgi:hypothetical protein
MGIIAGLNMSSVTRLKKTFDEIPQAAKEVNSVPYYVSFIYIMQQSFKNLEKLMNPSGSYKNYRTALHKSSLPALPYM